MSLYRNWPDSAVTPVLELELSQKCPKQAPQASSSSAPVTPGRSWLGWGGSRYAITPAEGNAVGARLQPVAWSTGQRATTGPSTMLVHATHSASAAYTSLFSVVHPSLPPGRPEDARNKASRMLVETGSGGHREAESKCSEGGMCPPPSAQVLSA